MPWPYRTTHWVCQWKPQYVDASMDGTGRDHRSQGTDTALAVRTMIIPSPGGRRFPSADVNRRVHREDDVCRAAVVSADRPGGAGGQGRLMQCGSRSGPHPVRTWERSATRLLATGRCSADGDHPCWVLTWEGSPHEWTGGA